MPARPEIVRRDHMARKSELESVIPLQTETKAAKRSLLRVRNLIVTATTAALIGSAATLAWQHGGRDESIPDRAPGSAAFDRDAPVRERIAALEAAVAMERQARQILEDELLVLGDTLAALTEPESGVAAVTSPAAADVDSPDDAERSRERSRRGRDESRREQLVGAGFTPAEAERIVRRESELRMAAIEARYEARRTGEPYEFSSRDALREELGDEAYSRYLEARGRPVNVTVSTVYEGSPALAAGLRPGDEIVRYDGRRVFSMNEISDMIVEGEPGENVAVDILRDGMPMQLSMPRGPLGVGGGRRWRR